jgi:hypothetical protein
MLERLRTRRRPAPFDIDELAVRTRDLFDFVERHLGFELARVERHEQGFTLTYKQRELGLALTVGADRRWGAGANAGRLDASGRLRPFGRDAWDAGDWWSLAHTIGAEPLNREDPEGELERIANLLNRRRGRLLRSAKKKAADRG